jgi:hypothetical protein
MGRICGMYGGEEKCLMFWWGNLKVTDHFEDLGEDVNKTLKWVV